MEIKTAKYAGFCFGVKRAVDTVFDLVGQKTGAHIYTIGSLIHNPNTNEKLAENGVGIIREEHIDEDLAKADPYSIFVVRTHGVPVSVL
jgi:4-hydroxy-3-methylbut-2-enyl diphosphate reductase